MINFLIFLSLLATITNLWYFSATIIPFLFCSLFLNFFLNKKKLYVNKLNSTVFCFFLYICISIVTNNAADLFDFDFYRYDGNVFISLSAFLFFHRDKIKNNLEKKLNILNKFFLCVTIYLFIVNIAFHKNFYPNIDGSYTFDFLYSSNNGSSGWAALYFTISYFQYIHKKNKFNLFSFFFSIILLIYIYSRGTLYSALLSLMLCVFSKYYNFSNYYKTPIYLFISSLIFSIILGIVALNSNSKNIQNSSNSYNSIAATDGGIREFNNKLRFDILYPTALEGFIESPIYGKGFSKFNDSLNFPKMEINKNEIYLYSDANAHNSYLHILYECGLIGIFLTYLFVYYLNIEIMKIYSTKNKEILIMYLNIILIASITEHRLFTPSMMLYLSLFYIFSKSYVASK